MILKRLSINLDRRKLTLFNRNGRLMQYRVLTMGSTPEYGKLTKALHSLLEGMSRVHVIYNNVILATATEAKHGMVVNTVLGKIQESVMTLNLQKPKFFASEVSFWEVLPNKHDMRPDPEKVKALKYATKPGDCQELICFSVWQGFYPIHIQEDSGL